ncbi:hypothetical protein AAEX28_16120 [Lentisphaerota bacterium WC36G]|nr:hypothetical protein LJT99_02875 [Lentisphaerae bacterium WC36]
MKKIVNICSKWICILINAFSAFIEVTFDLNESLESFEKSYFVAFEEKDADLYFDLNCRLGRIEHTIQLLKTACFNFFILKLILSSIFLTIYIATRENKRKNIPEKKLNDS